MGSLVLYYQYQAQIDYNYFYFHMLKTTLLIFIILFVTHQDIINAAVDPADLQYTGLWGNFGNTLKGSNSYYFGCGAQLQFQGDQGKWDDTAANGLRIRFCDSVNWFIQEDQSIPGQFGDWKGMQMCPEGSYIMGFQVRSEDNQGNGDDTAMNGLKIICRNPYVPFEISTSTKEVMVFQGNWGNWKAISQDKINFMNGFNTQYQTYQKGADNTGMNGLTFKLAKFKLVKDYTLRYILDRALDINPIREQRLITSQTRNCKNTSPITVTLSTTQSRNFTRIWSTSDSWSLGIKVGASISIGLEVFGKAQQNITFSAGVKGSYSIGTQQSFDITTSIQSDITVPAGQRVKSSVSVKVAEKKIPFILYVNFSDGTKRQSSGQFRGVVASNIVDSAENLPCL